MQPSERHLDTKHTSICGGTSKYRKVARRSKRNRFVRLTDNATSGITPEEIDYDSTIRPSAWRGIGGRRRGPSRQQMPKRTRRYHRSGGLTAPSRSEAKTAGPLDTALTQTTINTCALYASLTGYYEVDKKPTAVLTPALIIKIELYPGPHYKIKENKAEHTSLANKNTILPTTPVCGGTSKYRKVARRSKRNRFVRLTDNATSGITPEEIDYDSTIRPSAWRGIGGRRRGPSRQQMPKRTRRYHRSGGLTAPSRSEAKTAGPLDTALTQTTINTCALYASLTGYYEVHTSRTDTMSFVSDVNNIRAHPAAGFITYLTQGYCKELASAVDSVTFRRSQCWTNLSIEARREAVIRALILYLGEKEEDLFEDCWTLAHPEQTASFSSESHKHADRFVVLLYAFFPGLDEGTQR
ncbi:hypothetical protein D9C73_008771 [Collichthys lucidus]|uniref:Uncharacterized protein n=1 Tax=Collichthys lucidus TaxID=240159 RepID=A0A4U5UK30_COLLU|nr:hypothetical protein D9C73_008771 [Collichthys lucidus]